MRAAVDFRDFPDRKLGIALSRREPFVAEQLLNGPQVRALLEHVRAEGMAQGVGMDLGGRPLDKARRFRLSAADADEILPKGRSPGVPIQGSRPQKGDPGVNAYGWSG